VLDINCINTNTCVGGMQFTAVPIPCASVNIMDEFIFKKVAPSNLNFSKFVIINILNNISKYQKNNIRYDILKFHIFSMEGTKKCLFWAITCIKYDKNIVLHLSLTLFLGLNVSISLCKFLKDSMYRSSLTWPDQLRASRLSTSTSSSYKHRL